MLDAELDVVRPLCNKGMRACVLTAEIERIKYRAGQEEYDAGVTLYRRGMVSQADDLYENPSGPLCFWVGAKPRRQVRLRMGKQAEGRCNCPLYIQRQQPCRHVVAALLYAEHGGIMAGARQRDGRQAGEALLRALEVRLPLEATLRLEIQLHHRLSEGGGGLAVALRVGEERLYVVRDIRSFLQHISEREPLVFGKGFTLQPEWMSFRRTDTALLYLLQEAAEAIPAAEGMPPKWLHLSQAYAARALRLLMTRPFSLTAGGQTVAYERVWPGSMPVRLTARMAGQGLRLSAELPVRACALTADCEFVLGQDSVLRIPRGQRPLLRVLFAHARDGRADFRFGAQEETCVVSELLPQLTKVSELQLDAGLAQRMVRKPLEAAVYLDQEGRGIVARVAFRYGELHMDPFSPQQEGHHDTEGLILLRDAEGEQRVLDILAGTGFHVQSGRACLNSPEDVARFCTQGVQALQAVAQVYCSEEFRRISPRKPNLSGTLRMFDGGLHLELTESGEPIEDLLPLMEALRAQKRYFVLRNGAILDLSSMGEWLVLAETLSDVAQREGTGGTSGGAGVRLENFRAAYLAGWIGQVNLPIHVEAGVARIVEALTAGEAACPEPLAAQMRPYQRSGFVWLRVLQKAGMGGILADDMGLGKTVQAIALMLAMRRAEERLPALVVAPSSLVYNWQAEIAQYAPELGVRVIEGAQSARTAQIEEAGSPSAHDVWITSYPLLRRDIEALESVRFGVVMLDEAQYIKNPVSMSAVAAKRLRADARFALTGTPMENHPGELWSLFDFVLPGYLGGLARFMHRHGQGQHAEALRCNTQPFLLRRLKREVLTDLPEKSETRMLAEMTPEQSRVYQASLLRLSRRVDALLAQKGLQQGRMEVLAALTEMRQICCHPALCLADYAASSGKMDLLMDILPGALESGHRVLLFSQFTRMLGILQRRMEAQGIACLYLDGDTPGKERLQLTQRFNQGEGQVFLISLRAGGSGLNLTGADTVIHYDPWWNPAAEDQAADRAHRIGQKRPVQVIRLVTHGSIEEQVVRLGERKRALFDAVISEGGLLPSEYGEDEIRALFADLAQPKEERIPLGAPHEEM